MDITFFDWTKIRNLLRQKMKIMLKKREGVSKFIF